MKRIKDFFSRIWFVTSNWRLSFFIATLDNSFSPEEQREIFAGMKRHGEYLQRRVLLRKRPGRDMAAILRAGGLLAGGNSHQRRIARRRFLRGEGISRNRRDKETLNFIYEKVPSIH